MTYLDKFIRFYRTAVALKNMPKNVKSVFDIGCDNGYLLNKLDKKVKKEGIDPRLKRNFIKKNFVLKKGYFPNNVTNAQLKNNYEVIFALAVFEHFSKKDLKQSAKVISKMLTSKGIIVITVPDAKIDDILKFLKWIRLIDGLALEEHHHFQTNDIVNYFSEYLILKKHKKFQLGLNNLYIFEKRN